MKGTNIQVNGNVGTINVYNGRGASVLPCDVAPRSHDGSSWALAIGKWLVLLAGGAILLAGALVAAGLLATLALGLMLGAAGAVTGFYMLCRVGDLLRLIEHGLGGSATRLIGAAPVWRAIGPGHKVRELDALAIRKAEYVDSN